MNSPIFYLPTNKLYQKPDFEKHDQAMKKYLHSQLGQKYFDETMTVEGKWDQLMELFKITVPEADRKRFKSFQEKRKHVVDGNQFSLSLQDALVLFEHFYFLYSGDNAQFCISNATKVQFLEELKEGMISGVCEAGIVTRFNTHLRKYRSDNNWILVALHEQRSNIIQRIADEYNAINEVAEALSVHTVMHMVSLAKQKLLGVDNEKEINDAYAYLIQTSSMTAYFESVYEERFRRYEANVINNLAEHALFSMNTGPLNGVNLSEWEKDNEVLKLKDSGDIFIKLREFFQLFFSEDDLRSIMSDEADCILKKSDVLAKLKILVEKKLEQENFLVNFNKLDKKNTQNYNLRLPKDISVEMLCTFSEKLEKADNNPHEIGHVLNVNRKLVEKYPFLIASAVFNKPRLWRYLPRTLRNNSDFLDSLIGKIESLTKEKIDNGDVAECDSQIELLLMLIKPNCDLLRAYSSSFLLHNKKIALKLVAKNGLIYKYLSPKLQDDKEVMDVALKQNSTVSRYFPQNRESYLSYDQVILKSFRWRFNNNWKNSSLVEKVDKFDSVLNLLTKELMSLSTLTQLSQPLSPSELLWIIKERQQQGLQNLPELTEEGLTQFIDALDLTEEGWLPNYLDFKRRTQKNSQHSDQSFSFKKTYNTELANRCVAESNQWLTAFVAFQKQIPVYYKPFSGSEDVLDQLKLTGRIAFSFLKSIGESLRVLGRLGLNYAITLLPPLIEFYFNPYIVLIIESIAAYTGGMFLLWMLQLYAGTVIFNNWTGNNQNLFVSLMLLIVALLAPTGFITDIFILELACLGCYLFAAAIAASGTVLGTPWSFSDINTLASTALDRWLFATYYLLKSSVETVYHFGLKFIMEWPKHLSALILPWFTRSIASCSNTDSPATEENLLKIKVENSISRLLESESVSAYQKGTVLEFLWQKIQLDVEHSQGRLTFKEALNRKYTLSTDAKTCKKSFMDVAEMHRSDKEEFNPNTTQTRYSFFCIKSKTSTASNLQEYAGKKVDADDTTGEMLRDGA